MKSIRHFLSDQIWQSIGVLIAIVFGIISLYIFFIYQREVHDFQVVILANSSLVQVESSVADEIRVIYKEQQATNLSLVQIKLENTGNQTIRKEDFTTPLRFTFSEMSNIVEASVVETDPQNLDLQISQSKNIGIIEPTLFNEGDKAIIRFLVVDIPSPSNLPPFTVDARIANIKEVRLLNAIEEGFFSNAFPIWQAFGALLGITSVLISLFALNKQTRPTVKRSKAAFENRSHSELNSE